MSALEKNKDVWAMGGQGLDPKYEKCRNITEEIYKRINITFQIKKLESAGQSDVSDHSDQIDSNELSNETDLFACDKSDSISSSTEAEKPIATCERYININNNEELKTKKPAVVYKRPRKRFRKRVKKRQTARAHSDTEGSSDEAVPLSRMVEVDSKSVDNDDNIMGVPNIVILTRDLKPKIQSDKRSFATTKDSKKLDILVHKPEEKKKETEPVNRSPTVEKSGMEWKSCTMCSLTFRGGRGLRRHMTMSHTTNQEETIKSTEQRDRNLDE
ncbi:unnamed protein product [Arctia plantaginis]|uniref:C2H2-type domain-containing protein n=1 Tax=Arctia plantaginis TaxID=874455 RepID=A0A8S1A0F9_ARCPL|nr:unnamed protein product [Arctia plantaginis]